MHQLLHLFVVDHARDVACAARANGRWLLPVLALSQSARVGAQIDVWLDARGLEGHPVGQWFGRLSPTGAADWLVVVDARGALRTSALGWVPVDELRASPSLIEYQTWAVARALAGRRGPAHPGPFGDPAWLSHVSAWIADQLGQPFADRRHLVAYRLSPYEVVLEWRAAHRRWFFKGLTRERSHEARLTQTFAQLCPDRFASTVAVKYHDDGSAWWLMEACPGAFPAHLDESASSVVAEYARIQQIVARFDDGSRYGTPRIDLATLSAWATEMADEHSSAIADACADASCLPVSWVAADLDPGNVLLDGTNVRFIDLDDALWGPAALGLAIFVRRVVRATAGCAARDVLEERLLETYQKACDRPPLVRRSWKSVQLVAELVEIELVWQRLELMSARGEIHGALLQGQAALRRRLVTGIERYRKGAPP